MSCVPANAVESRANDVCPYVRETQEPATPAEEWNLVVRSSFYLQSSKGANAAMNFVVVERSLQKKRTTGIAPG
jgi:hypothetical protein